MAISSGRGTICGGLADCGELEARAEAGDLNLDDVPLGGFVRLPTQRRYHFFLRSLRK